MASFNEKTLNESEFRSMQEEAVRRVRDMQRRSQSIVNQPNINANQRGHSNGTTANPSTTSAAAEANADAEQAASSAIPPPAYEQSQEQPQSNQGFRPQPPPNPLSGISEQLSSFIGGLFGTENKGNTGLLGSILQDFKLDEEKIILGILIYILAKNGADLKLILALGYLIL